MAVHHSVRAALGLIKQLLVPRVQGSWCDGNITSLVCLQAAAAQASTPEVHQRWITCRYGLYLQLKTMQPHLTISEDTFNDRLNKYALLLHNSAAVISVS